ncbi:MAG: hypothetical protein H6703_12790 [Myxococcales bacterium]|nr:hypothetical protein [Myxococcales bacterium]
MRDSLVPALTVLAMGLVVYAFIGDAACNDPPPPLDAGPPPPDAALPLDAYVQDARPPPPPRPDDDSLTLEDVRRLGLVDMPEVWIDRLLAGSADWTRDPDTPAPTFVNHRGTRVTFKVRGGRVQGVGAELGEGALSAEVALLGGFVVGYNDRLPLHFEAPDRDTLVKTRGSFDDSQGRRWYYRAQMRREGEPPYGPAVVELAPEPFPGQSGALDPPALPPGVAPPPDLGLPE